MPSKKILEQKQAAVLALADKLRLAQAGVLVDYKGITVEDDTRLRATLRAAGVEYMVLKNTMTGRACEQVGYGEMQQYLTGMTALALGMKDPVSPAKILKEFAGKVKLLEIKAGFVDGGVIDATGVEALAAIPSKEQLIVKFMGSLLSPLYGLAYVLQAKIDKETGGNAETPAEAVAETAAETAAEAPAEAPAQA
ncbi:MAG: 50S ribosomal protein L10 [Eubacteriales bacterium]